VGYHRAIEHCIEAGIARFDPGHGGEYKRLRGFDPVFAHSAHWFADPALHRAVLGWAEGEAAWVRERVQEERSRGPLAAAED